MLKSTSVLSVGHGEFGVGSKGRRVWCWSRSTFRRNSVKVRSLRSRIVFVEVYGSPGRGGCVDAFGRGRVESKGMAEARLRRAAECGERGNETEGELEPRVQDRRENLSYEEMVERWEFLQRLPHKLLRDIGYTTLGPSLLSSSKELPVVSSSMLGGSSSQWPVTKTWLQQLSIPAVEAWFAAHRSSQRLGDHFALCIEYVLRHSPHVEVQQLLTSQQVLQRVTEPVRNSRALQALESKLLARKSSSWCNKTPMVGEPVSTDRPDRPLSVCVGPLQGEQLQVSPEYSSTTLGESIHNLEAMDLNEKNVEVVGGTLQSENVGKRKRKLLKKLERVRLRKGKTTTIGEFDFLFEIPPADGNLKGKEFHHWEVSVKYLLYAGPWEVFGVRSPPHAAWSNPDTEDHDSKVDSLSQGLFKEGDSRADETNCHLNAAEDDRDFLLEPLDEGGCSTLQHFKWDNFLGCYLGPHVGETLLDRQARLRNQLALSANPCAALMLRDLYTNKGADGSADKERTKGLKTILVASSQSLESSTTMKNGDSSPADLDHDREGVPEEDSIGSGSANKEGARDVVVVPSALLKGYLFYEYKLWRYLEERSASRYSSTGTRQIHHDTTSESIDVEMTCQPGTKNSVTEKVASLNTNHWKGWWTRDLMEFADLPAHQQSKWYIVPKLEWLSPVVIPESDADRCARVLSLSDFLVTAAQVADEAVRLCMARKRRFLVAEIRWTSDWEFCGEQATVGAWVEVSRGFVVEDTWPDTRIYKPHGYVVSWSSSLQGRQVGVPET